MEKRKKYLSAALLGLYAGLMLFLLFFRTRADAEVPYLDRLPMHINLRPLRTIRMYLRLLNGHRAGLMRIAVINLAGNVLMFIPLGFLLPLVFRGLRKWYRTVLTAAGIVAAVELLQMLFLVGACDVDDLILNLMGTAIGFGLYAALRRFEK